MEHIHAPITFRRFITPTVWNGQHEHDSFVCKRSDLKFFFFQNLNHGYRSGKKNTEHNEWKKQHPNNQMCYEANEIMLKGFSLDIFRLKNDEEERRR